jgi:hypothetical protein
LSLAVYLVFDNSRIPKIDAVCETHVVRTGRNKPLIHSVVAQIALEGFLVLFVEIYGVVRAGFHAALTSCAHILVEYDNAIFSFRNGLFRAGPGTGRVVAMLTHSGTMEILQLVSCHLRPVFVNVNEFDLVVVFLFAGYLASSAAPTQFIIYYERKLIHCVGSLQVFSG